MFFQAEDGIRGLVRSRGLGDVYKRQARHGDLVIATTSENDEDVCKAVAWLGKDDIAISCLLYTSDAADERSSVDLGGRRIIKKKKNAELGRLRYYM